MTQRQRALVGHQISARHVNHFFPFRVWPVLGRFLVHADPCRGLKRAEDGRLPSAFTLIATSVPIPFIQNITLAKKDNGRLACCRTFFQPPIGRVFPGQRFSHFSERGMAKKQKRLVRQSSLAMRSRVQ